MFLNNINIYVLFSNFKYRRYLFTNSKSAVQTLQPCRFRSDLISRLPGACWDAHCSLSISNIILRLYSRQSLRIFKININIITLCYLKHYRLLNEIFDCRFFFSCFPSCTISEVIRWLWLRITYKTTKQTIKIVREFAIERRENK